MKENVSLFSTTLKNKYISIIQNCYEQRGKNIDYNWLVNQSDATIYAMYKRETEPKKVVPLNQMSFEDIQDEMELWEIMQEYFNKELDLKMYDYYNSHNLYNEYHQVDYNGAYDINGHYLPDRQRMENQETMRLLYRDKR